MSGAGLECCGVHLAHRAVDGSGRVVLRDIDATFAPAAVALVEGATGAGKSTLLHLLASLLRPTQGEVRAAGEPVSRWGTAHRDRWRRDVGVMFQSARFLSQLGVLENVMVPLLPRGLQLAELRDRGRAALDRAGAGHLVGQPLNQLSVGEQQRVSLARALVAEPTYLLLDEPTAHQDDIAVSLVLGCLRRARERGAVVVVASHDPRLKDAAVHDRRWVLRAGQLEETG